MEALITELKKHIIEVLNLEDLQPEDIEDWVSTLSTPSNSSS